MIQSHRLGRPRTVRAIGRLRRSWLPYVLVAPLVIVVGGLVFYPTVATSVEAFFYSDPLRSGSGFAGLSNFRTAFSDPLTRTSLVNTALYGFVGITGSTLLGIVFAFALRNNFRFRGLLLAIVVLPWALPPVAEAVIWSWIFDPTFGVLNSLLKSAHIIGAYQVWVGVDRITSVILIELVQIWQLAPLSTLIILASLQTIPQELYEAAQLDGARGWSCFRRVTLPLIRPGIAIAAVQALVLSLNVFDQVYVLNFNAPTAISATLTIYADAFRNLNFGEGYALSLLLTLATVVLSLGVLGLVYRRVEY
jgi:multiple sugar transport system permease protein